MNNEVRGLTRWICSTPDKAWTEQKPTPGGRAQAGLALSGQRYQKWSGFGGCFNELGWDGLQALSPAKRDQVIRSLFARNGCGFNFCRMPIGSSDFGLQWYSHNENDGDFAMRRFSIERDRHYLIPYIKSAMECQPKLTLFASPWSPPTWLKFPKAYNYGRLIWEKKYLTAYALYFVKFVQAYAREGIRIDQIHPQNEPVADQKFPSCLWSGAQMRDFIRDYLGPAFKKHNLDCEIWLGTLNTDDYNEYTHKALSDARARAYIGGVSYQWWGKSAIQRAHQAWPDVRLIQSENECGDGRNTWDYAQYIFNLIQHYVTNGVDAYVYWNMVLPAGGVSTWGWAQNSMINIDKDSGRVMYNPEFHLMKHFGHFVKPGAQVVGLSGPWSGNALAFENPDRKLVVVVNNPFGEERRLVLNAKNRRVACDLPVRSFNTFVLS
jgi:glucosylceramidase